MTERYVLLAGETVIEVPRREQFATEEVRLVVRYVQGWIELDISKTVNRTLLEWELHTEIQRPIDHGPMDPRD